MITPNDISIVLSGGSTNRNPDLSIGGDPSQFPISPAINNLFDNISESTRLQGMTDYRCIYIVNNSLQYSLFNIETFIREQVPGGSTVQIGTKNQTEIQQISLNAPMSYTLIINDTPVNVPSEDKEDLITALIPFYEDIDVETSALVHTLNFVGKNDSHYYPLITSPTPGVTTTKVQDGSPINVITIPLDSKVSIPVGITFGDTTLDTGILKELKPSEIFFLWVKRETPAGASQQDHDGFSLRILGDAFQ